MQFVSLNVVFHEKKCVLKFLRCIFSKLFGCNTEQFLFYGRISFVRYIEPTDYPMWEFFLQKLGR